MTPSQASQALRQVATAIDNSKSPRRELVVSDLKKILVAMGEEAQAPQEQVALPSSGAGKNMLKKMLADAQAALDSGDDATFKELLEKIQKHS